MESIGEDHTHHNGITRRNSTPVFIDKQWHYGYARGVPGNRNVCVQRQENEMCHTKRRDGQSSFRCIILIAFAVFTLTALATPDAIFAADNPPPSATTAASTAHNTGMLLQSQTVAELRRVAQKEALVKAWSVQSHSGGSTGAAAYIVSPNCVIDPDTGKCVTLTVHSLGGEFTQEPYDEPNWCGPSAATAVMMHWNYNQVIGFGTVTVRNDGNTGNESYSGAQGFMAWMANLIWIPADNRNGVSEVPYSGGSPIGWLKDGLNVAVGTNYYVVHTSTTAADMQANVEYDISHDGHPMIYLADAQYLPEWTVSYPVYHYVEGYGWGYYSDGLTVDYFADAISAADTRATAGDNSLAEDSMYYAVQHAFSDFIV